MGCWCVTSHTARRLVSLVIRGATEEHCESPQARADQVQRAHVLPALRRLYLGWCWEAGHEVHMYVRQSGIVSFVCWSVVFMLFPCHFYFRCGVLTSTLTLPVSQISLRLHLPQEVQVFRGEQQLPRVQWAWLQTHKSTRCMSMYVCMCVYLCMDVCMYVRMYVCKIMYVCMYAY